MEAELKSTQRFISPLIGIFLIMVKIGRVCLKSAVFNHLSVYFQQYLCLFMFHITLKLGIKYPQGMDTNLKTHLSFDPAKAHRPLLFCSPPKHHVYARFCIVNSAPVQSVRVYNDLMDPRTNTAKLNWLLYNVGSYGIIQHSSLVNGKKHQGVLYWPSPSTQ